MFCARCGNQADETARYCDSCGSPLGVSATVTASDTPVAKATPAVHDIGNRVVDKEVTFYVDEAGVRITNTRLIVPGATYAMANITSVKTETVNPSYSGVFLTIVVGVAFLIGASSLKSGSAAALGVLVVFAGIVWAVVLKPEYKLGVSSASGERSPLSSRDEAYIDKIVQAINEAIIHRG